MGRVSNKTHRDVTPSTGKLAPNKSWRLYREYHSLCLKQRDRSWAEDCDMKVGNPMNLGIYDSIHRSVDDIIAYSDQESDVVQGLYKLYNGG